MMSNPKHESGFIFMCNSVTKPTCFRYRVFGFPMSKKDVVDKIKPGAKLFLFDVELKLLYGIYEATSNGQVNLEPDAFGGKFPAQVKFKIFGGYLPLPEKSFRGAIIENYQGKKFSPELNEVQVKKLQLLFRPLSSSSSSPARLPRRIADQSPTPQPRYLHEVTRRVIGPPQPLHGIQMAHQHHIPHTAAQNTSIMSPIEQYYHVNSQPQTYYTQQHSSGGHPSIVQEPIRRHDDVLQETTQYYQTIRSESEYRISQHRNASHHQKNRLPLFEGQSQRQSVAALPYNYNHKLQPYHPPETVPLFEGQSQRQSVAALPYNFHHTLQPHPHPPETVPLFEGQSQRQSVAALPYNYHHTLQPYPHPLETGSNRENAAAASAAYDYPSMPSTTVTTENHLPYNYHHTLQPYPSETVPNGETTVAAAAYYYQALPPSLSSSTTVTTTENPLPYSNYHHTLQPYPPQTASNGETIAAANNYHHTLQPYPPQTASNGETIAAANNYHHTLQPYHPPQTVTAYYNTVPATEPYVPSTVVGSYPPVSNPYVLSANANTQI